MSHIVRLAAGNNADWCDAICRAHGRPGSFSGTLWFNTQPTPPFYPNAVTLVPDSQQSITEALPSILAGAGSAFAVKDSFQSLDLAPLDFDPIFDASWIVRKPAPVASSSSDLNWRVIGSAAELQLWERTWASGEAGEPIFLPNLLDNPDVTLIGGWRGAAIVAGAALNRSAGVLGWSNVFVPPDDPIAHIAGALRLATSLAGDLPLVGYEHGDPLAQSIELGFEPVGGLRVWGYRGS